MRKLKPIIVDWLFDRQASFYNLIGGNLVGGGLGITINLILQSPNYLKPWAVILGGIDILSAGFLMSKIAWKIGVYWKKVEVKETVEEDYDTLKKYKRDEKEKGSSEILSEFILAIIIVLLALLLMSSKALSQSLFK